MSRALTIALANSGRKWIGEVAHVAMLYEQLEALGHRPWIVCRRGFALEARARAAGWRHLALTFASGFHPARDGADVVAWVDWVRREHVDVLHCHRGKDHWLGAAVARWTRRPLVRTRHVVMPVRHHALNAWLYLKLTGAVLGVSEATRRSFGRWAPRLPRGEVILSAVDAEAFHPGRRRPDWRAAGPGELPVPDGEEPLWFGLVGRIQRIKGQTVFLEAAARVAAQCPRARFLLAGHGDDGQHGKLIARAEDLGLTGRVRHADWLEDLPEALASLDVGVIASLGSEGSSRIGLEMMASGLPLVGTRVGGVPDLGQGSDFLRLVPPGDPEALAGAMLAWAADPEARRAAGEAARLRAATEHAPAVWAERFVAVYRALGAGEG